MPPSLVERIKDRLPGLNPRLVDEHMRRLDERYFERFCEDEIAAHLEGLAVLGSGHPVQVIAGTAARGTPAYTVLAFDHQGAFSLISGVLSALGFDIRSGDIFTWAPPDSPDAAGPVPAQASHH